MPADPTGVADSVAASVVDLTRTPSEEATSGVAGYLRDVQPGAGLIFEDGFESGNTSAWSSTTP